MAWVRTGTLSLTNGSASVVGTGTQFRLGQVGDMLTINSVIYEIGAINSDTSIALVTPYAGTTASGVTNWSIVQTQSRTKAMNDAVAALVSDQADLLASFGPLRAGAESFQELIEDRVDDAELAATNAETARLAAVAAKIAAETAKTATDTTKGQIDTIKGQIDTAKAGADTAKAGADTAKTAAENARDAAVTAKTAAETARDAALAAYDGFDDRYLGAKTSNPTLDNDGNALVGGALYMNTTAVPAEMRLWTGTSWTAAYVTGGSFLPYAGGTMTGPIALSADPAAPLQPATKQYVDSRGNATITVSGDASGSGTTAVALTLASVGTPGTYKSVTVDAKGRVTAGTNPTTLSGYGITDAVATTSFTYTNLPGKPATFTPSAHSHVVADVTGLQTALDGKQASLGFTAENAANRGAVNGYASLDGTGKVPAGQLPGFVDDILEFANFAAFPLTGTQGVLYVDMSNDKTYRWSGSAYRIIVASPGTTDAITEGTTNLYFSQARARASFTATQNLTLNASTGVLTGPDLSGYLTSAAAASTYQPTSTSLTNLLALGTAGFVKKTAANTYSLDTTSYLSGTVSVLNGGTGLTSLTAGYVPRGNGTSAYSASTIYDTGSGVGILTTSPQAPLHVSGTVRVRTGTNGFSTVEPGLTTENSGYLAAWSGASVRIGYCGFYNGSIFTAASTDGNTPLVFGANNAERMRITTDGSVLIGTTTSIGSYSGAAPANPGISMEASGSISAQRSNNCNLFLSKATGAINNDYIGFFYNGSFIGSVGSNLSSVSFNTSSDATLKNDDGDLSAADACRIVTLIKIHKFNWKTTGRDDIGVFAQELHEIYPAAVTKGGWRCAETGALSDLETEGAVYAPWSVDYSKLMPVVIRATQDHEVRLAALEASVSQSGTARKRK